MLTENKIFMQDLRDTLVHSAKIVNDNFGKSVEELGTEYKSEEGDTARTLIDRYAQERMEGFLLPRYPDAIYNLEEADVKNASLEKKLLIFGDPFDGTANAQPKLPLSTQGLMAAKNGNFIAAAALHPFEKYILFGAKGQGVFRTELNIDSNGEYYLKSETQRQLPSLEKIFEELKSGKQILMPYVDANYTPVNFVAQRKTKWKQLFVETFDKEYRGRFNARMMREMGSNIDSCMKLTEGRLHCQLTDTVGGIYDIAAAAIFLPELGGVMTDMYGHPLQVPKTAAEMKTPSQQVLIASIHPELHTPLVEMTQKCYGENSRVFIPSREKVVTLPEYTGFKQWDIANKKVFDSLNR